MNPLDPVQKVLFYCNGLRRSSVAALQLTVGKATPAQQSTEDELRGALYSLTFLVTRLVLVDPEELALVFRVGEGAELQKRVDVAVAEHLVVVMRRLLGVG